MDPKLSVFVLVAAGVFSGVAPAADLDFFVFGGAQCDAPAVRDGDSFDSSCSVEPLAGAAMSFPGPSRGNWRLEARGQYSRRSFGSSAFATDTDIRTEFVELALVGTLPVYESSDRFRVAAVFGPQLGVLLRARRRFRDVDQDVTDQLRATEFRLVTGIRVWSGRIFVEGSFAWGLTDLDNTNQQQIHSRDAVVKLGIIF